MVVQFGFATRRTPSVTRSWFTPAATSGTLRVAAVGVALVDDAVAELEQPRHVPLAVLVVEGDEAPGRRAARRPPRGARRRGPRAPCRRMLVGLVPARVEVDQDAPGPRPGDERRSSRVRPAPSHPGCRFACPSVCHASRGAARKSPAPRRLLGGLRGIETRESPPPCPCSTSSRSPAGSRRHRRAARPRPTSSRPRRASSSASTRSSRSPWRPLFGPLDAALLALHVAVYLNFAALARPRMRPLVVPPPRELAGVVLHRGHAARSAVGARAALGVPSVGALAALCARRASACSSR